MTYHAGFSTGWWHIGKAPELVGLASKIGYGATFGVDYLQIDLETIQEFIEPYMKYQVDRVRKELGLNVGLHALIGENDALERGDRKVWDASHKHAVVTVQRAAELKFEFINFHLSLTPQLIMQEAQLRPFGHQYQVVGPDGRPLYVLGDSFPDTKKFILDWLPSQFADDEVMHEGINKISKEIEATKNRDVENAVRQWKNSAEYANLRDIMRQELKRRGAEEKDLNNLVNGNMEDYEKQKRAEETRKIDEKIALVRRGSIEPEQKYEMWKKSSLAKYFVDWGEIGAYMIIAYHMWKKREPLWMKIVGDMHPRDAYDVKHPEFNAAVASFYIKGHLTVKDHPYNKQFLGGMSILEYCNKNKLLLTFEIPHVGSPGQAEEGRYRLFHPKDSQHFVKDIGSPFIALCIDIEHMLSQGLNPYEVFNNEVDADFGKLVRLIHLGKPIGYGGTAHIPIPLGSLAQYAIYEWMYMLREKGFKDGILIYERGGGDTPAKVVEQSIQVIRLIRDHLEKGIPPEELPESFFGVSEMNDAKYKLQLNAIREHAWDPLKGLMIIPEEDHTFLGRAAVEKGKAEEWKKAKFR